MKLTSGEPTLTDRQWLPGGTLPSYLERGYVVFGELPAIPPGHTQYFLCKPL